MPRTVDTIYIYIYRERVNSRELNFICCAQNVVLAGIGKLDFIVHIKDGLYSNIKVVM